MKHIAWSCLLLTICIDTERTEIKYIVAAFLVTGLMFLLSYPHHNENK